MIELDEDALICDLAETYGIHDYRQYKPLHVATLAAGLRDDSRIRMKLSGMRITTSQLIEAYAADRLAVLVWMQSKDGQHNRNKPKSLLEKLIGDRQKKNSDIASFNTTEEFEAAMARIEARAKER